MGFRLKEVIKSVERSCYKVDKKALAALMWPNSSKASQAMSFSNLYNGKTREIKPEWVGIVCRELGCEPNDLFEWEYRKGGNNE